MGLRRALDRLEPRFLKGGKWHGCYPLYEAIDTILGNGVRSCFCLR